jgi:hypothetical protein
LACGGGSSTGPSSTTTTTVPPANGPAVTLTPPVLAFPIPAPGTASVPQTVTLTNSGTTDLVITSVQRLMGSTGFSVLATPGTPLVIEAGEHVDFTVRYLPTGVVTETATIRILSNDPTAPAVDLSATGVPGSARLTITDIE